MEERLHFRLTNSASVTAFSYHPIRREIVTGHEGEIRKNIILDAMSLLRELQRFERVFSPMLRHAHHWLTTRCFLVDGSIKCWESDSGKPTASLLHHEGWITDLLYWSVRGLSSLKF